MNWDLIWSLVISEFFRLFISSLCIGLLLGINVFTAWICKKVIGKYSFLDWLKLLLLITILTAIMKEIMKI